VRLPSVAFSVLLMAACGSGGPPDPGERPRSRRDGARAAETDIDVDHVNRLGWTALLEAVILGDGGPDHQRIVERLVDAGADRAIADEDGVTALEHARDRGYTEIVELLERR
jgi:hypothetical protein